MFYLGPAVERGILVTRKVSARLAVLRFPLIVGVVFIHEYAMRVALQKAHIADNNQVNLAAKFIQNLVSQGIARLAVPLFFLMSGFLFFQAYDGTLSAYRTKLLRRIRTLFIPYLIWNALTLLAIVLKRPQPSLRAYFATRYYPPILIPSLWNYASAFLGITTKYPVSYQFWFIRDLIVLVIMAPAIFFLLKQRSIGLLCLALLCGLWLSARWPVPWPADESMFFFFCGSYLAIHNVDVCAFDNQRLLFGVSFALLLLAAAWLGTDGYVRRCMILAGLPFAWWLSDLLIRTSRAGQALVYLSGASFFVFAVHEPPLSTIGRVVFTRVQPQTSIAEVAIFFLLPAGLIGMLVLLWIALDRAVPNLLNVLTGRERKQEPVRLRRTA